MIDVSFCTSLFTRLTFTCPDGGRRGCPSPLKTSWTLCLSCAKQRLPVKDPSPCTAGENGLQYNCCLYPTLAAEACNCLSSCCRDLHLFVPLPPKLSTLCTLAAEAYSLLLFVPQVSRPTTVCTLAAEAYNCLYPCCRGLQLFVLLLPRLTTVCTLAAEAYSLLLFAP